MKTHSDINAKIEMKQAVVMTAEEINGYVERKSLDTNTIRSYRETRNATGLSPTTFDRYKGLPPSHQKI